MPLVAVPDACVLLPASIRDTIFHAAAAYIYRMKLTDDILNEVCRNLTPHLEKRGMSPEIADASVQRLGAEIKRTFEDSFVVTHRELIDKMPVNVKDRHVMAAAVVSDAQIIVTENLRHFPRRLLEPSGIIAQSADTFLSNLFYDNPQGMVDVIVKQSWSLHNPPKSVTEVLEGLRAHAPTFARLILREMNLTTGHPWPAYVRSRDDAR